MPRPRKVITESPEGELIRGKQIERIIAEVAHEYCGIPGCMTKMHIEEASAIVDALKESGFIITIKELY